MIDEKSKEHEFYMRRALELARQGEGLTRPNPPVGAVVVKNGKIIGEGYHRKAGGPHAEVFALHAAGREAQGATLFVTLEPCSTWGRTAPCTESILASGIKQVVVCTQDPNPAHAGRGLRFLKRKKIELLEGVCEEEGRLLIAPFAKWITKNTPYLTLKLAMSMDGKIADRFGKSRWITGEESRKRVHAMRRRADAILVGRQTLTKDNPFLLPKPDEGREPFRVVVDSRGKSSMNAKLFTDDFRERTIFATTDSCSKEVRYRLEAKGVRVLVLPESQGKVSLAKLMKELGRLRLLHVLCEGGSELAEGLIKARLVDAYCFFYAPCIIGGHAKSAVAGEGWPLASKPRLKIRSCERVGEDILIRAEPA